MVTFSSTLSLILPDDSVVNVVAMDPTADGSFLDASQDGSDASLDLFHDDGGFLDACQEEESAETFLYDKNGGPHNTPAVG